MTVWLWIGASYLLICLLVLIAWPSLTLKAIGFVTIRKYISMMKQEAPVDKQLIEWIKFGLFAIVMTVVTVLLFVLVCLFAPFVALYFYRKNYKSKNKFEEELKKLHGEIFPNDREDIDKGTDKLLEILDNRIDREEAEQIFVKSASICYMTSLEILFTEERLTQHLAPYALKYFKDDELEQFYMYLMMNNNHKHPFHLFHILSLQSKSNPGGLSDDDDDFSADFGLYVDNPIPTASILESTVYLNRLRTKDGAKITYNRIGSTSSPKIDFPIDAYAIYVNGEKIETIYLCPYGRKTSKRVPEGYVLVDN